MSAMAGTIMSEHVISNGPAAGRRFRNEVADSVHLHLDFGHFFATCDVSWCVPASRNETLEVYGEHGTCPATLPMPIRPSISFAQAVAGLWTHPRHACPGATTFRRSPPRRLSVHDTEPIPSATHARHVLDIMLTALRSAQEGRTLTLQTTFQLPTATP